MTPEELNTIEAKMTEDGGYSFAFKGGAETVFAALREAWSERDVGRAMLLERAGLLATERKRFAIASAAFEEAQRSAEHWRQEAELRQALLENERELTAIHERQRDEAWKELTRLRDKIEVLSNGWPDPDDDEAWIVADEEGDIIEGLRYCLRRAQGP